MSKVNELETVENTTKSRGWLPRLSYAAIALVAIGLLGGWLVQGRPGSAFTVLAQAAEAAQSLGSTYIEARMRTSSGDNFDMLKPDSGFIPINMLVAHGSTPKWRVDKRRTSAVMDGERVLFVKRTGLGTTHVHELPPTATGVVGWLAPLLDVEKLFEAEQQKAREEGAQVSVERGSGGKVILTIRSKAQGDYSQSDYLKNKLIITSDNTRIYTFDAQTHRLVDVEVYVNLEGKDVLVFETTAIRYDLPVTASMFEPEIPKDAVWSKSADEMSLPDNRCTTPRETAEATLRAMAEEDWDTLRGLAGSSADEPRFQEFVGGLEIVSIGEPFKSGKYPGWFVPYEVRLKDGTVKKHNLAVRNDTKDGRWILDGGF